jgi:hypothetical protein
MSIELECTKCGYVHHREEMPHEWSMVCQGCGLRMPIVATPELIEACKRRIESIE